MVYLILFIFAIIIIGWFVYWSLTVVWGPLNLVLALIHSNLGHFQLFSCEVIHSFAVTVRKNLRFSSMPDEIAVKLFTLLDLLNYLSCIPATYPATLYFDDQKSIVIVCY